MADTIVVLPSGEEIVMDVPDGWDATQVRTALVKAGEIQEGSGGFSSAADNPPRNHDFVKNLKSTPVPPPSAAVPEPTPVAPEAPAAPVASPSAAEAAAFGYVANPNMIGTIKELIDRKVGATDDETVESTVLRKEGVPEDVPVFADEEGVTEVQQTFTQKGTTEEEIKAAQDARREQALRGSFPEIMADADATRDSVPFMVGEGVRMFTDLLSVPLPATKLKALSETVKGGKVLSSATGRAAAAASLEGAVGVGAFSAVDNSLRQLHEAGEINKDELATATMMGAAIGSAMVPALGVGIGKIMKRFNKALDNGGTVTAEDIMADAPAMTGKEVDDLLVGFDEMAFAAKMERKAKISMDTNVNAAKAERAGANTHALVLKEKARAKARASVTPEAKEAAMARYKGEDAALSPLERNNLVPRDKAGDVVRGLSFGNAVIDRLENISPTFAPRLRAVTQQTNTKTHRDMKRMNTFFKHKDYKRMSRADKQELKGAMLDSDGPRIREITNKYGDELTANYEKNVRGLIDEIGEAKVALRGKRDGFVSGYHPRQIVNFRKARAALGRKDRSALDGSIRDAVHKKGRPLNPQESEQIVSAYLKGMTPAAKNRRVEGVGSANAKLYEDIDQAMMGYIHRHHEEQATSDFFKKFGIDNVKGGESPDAASISKVLTESLLKGELREKDVQEAAELIHAIFGRGRQAPNKFLQDTKSAATVSAIANPMSTLTQLQDVAQLVDQHGLVTTVQSLFGRRMANVFDMGLKNEAQSMRTERGWKRGMQEFMRMSGFSQLDEIMATAGVNASIRNGFKHVKGKSNVKAARKYREMGFSEAEAGRLVDDLRNEKITDLVRTLSVVENGKIRPVDITDLPEALVNNPNGRVFGTLLTWTMKQINRLRNGAYKDMRTPGRRMRGVGKMTRLLTLMGLTNMSVGAMKRILKDEEQDPYSDFTAGMLGLGMTGKFMADAAVRGDPAKFVTAATPYASILGQIVVGGIQSGYKATVNEDPSELLHAADGIGSVRNWKAIAEGPTLPAVGALFGAGYDFMFEGDNARDRAVIVDTVKRLPPNTDGGDLMPKPENMNNDASMDVIKEYENSIKAGLDPVTGKWFGHDSIEGGTQTLAYGHKLTGREVNSGKVKIGDRWADYREGLTEMQAEELFQQDMGKARETVMSSLSVPLSQNEVVALTSLVFNVGATNWKKSKARKALNAGNREEFLHQAYDPRIGFVKVNGKINGGLVKRRAAEKAVFLGQ